MKSMAEELERIFEQRNHAWKTLAAAVDMLEQGGGSSALAFILARVPRLQEREEFDMVIEGKIIGSF